MAHGVEDAPRRRLSGLECELTVGTSASTISATRVRNPGENSMSFKRGIAAAVVAATGIVCTVQIAVADESGTFTVISSMTTDYTTISHAGGTVIGGASEGTSTTIESSGGPFVEGGHSHTTCVGVWKTLGRRHGARGGLHVDNARRRRAVLDFEKKCGRRRRRRRRCRRAHAHGWDREQFRGHRNMHVRGRLSGEQPICLARRVRLAALRRTTAMRANHPRSVRIGRQT